jgi:FkbM family methyltransferase
MNDMKELLLRSNIELDGDGYIKIPAWVKRVKIDVGLSDGAPQSAKWLEIESDLLVFGFEPNHHNVAAIRARSSDWSVTLNPQKINHSFYLIECALSNVTQKQLTPFYYTSNDPGCSSLLEPNEFPVGEVVNVETWSLNNFFKYFPFHQIPYIDFVKTDCQGVDIEVIKGCSEYLDKIAIFTCEADDTRYKGSNNSFLALQTAFASNGFFQYHPYMKTFSKIWGPRLKYIHTEDPTFINKSLAKQIAQNKIRAYQEG